MQLIPLKTSRISPHQDLFDVLKNALEAADQKLEEGDILIIASKIIAYSQGRLVNVKDDDEFKSLIRKEADRVLDEGMMTLTMKNKILIPNAGIDRSNVPEGQVVLWPQEPFEWARAFWQKLMESYNLKRIGIVVSDSHCQPLRQGTSGLALAWAGFEGVKDERGSVDLFGRAMSYTKIAVADNLASAALLEMGETDASVPMVIARGVKVEFTDRVFSEKGYFMSPKNCLYRPLMDFKGFL